MSVLMEVSMWLTLVGCAIAGLVFGYQSQGVLGAVGGLLLGAIAGILANTVWWLFSKFQEIRDYSARKCGWLYDFETAKLICPKGWRLPSDAEWTALGNTVGGSSTAGTVLKAKSSWEENGNGEDVYGFSAFACGYLNTDGNFHNYGSSTHFWSATNKGDAAWDRNLYSNKTGMVRNMHDKAISFSVRCVKD